jgi:hypothetical protein
MFGPGGQPKRSGEAEPSSPSPKQGLYQKKSKSKMPLVLCGGAAFSVTADQRTGRSGEKQNPFSTLPSGKPVHQIVLIPG